MVHRPGWQTLACAATLFVLNVYIAGRLFQVDFYNHLSSVEGVFVGLTRFISQNWGDLTWLPIYYAGMPFHHVYAPGMPVSAAAIATVMHFGPGRGYHFALGLFYSLGPPFLFWTAWRLSGRFAASYCAGLLWSVFSPSCVLFRSVWHDTGEMISNRRLHSIIGWGDGANGVGLGFAVLAIGMLHLALTRKRVLDYAGASLSVALVMLFSWPATVAMAMALFCYLLSREVSEWRGMIVRLAVLGAVGYAAAAAWVPPSTLFATFARSQVMGSPFPPGQAQARAIVSVLVLIAMAGVRFVLGRLGQPFWFRFAALYFILTAAITIAVEYTGLVLIAQAMRFHLAMELGFILTLVFGASLLLSHRRRWQYAMALIVVLFVVRQTILARRYARMDAAPVNRAGLIEAETADWFDANMHGERVWASGSDSFWMNAFTSTPQLGGCCDQASTNPAIDIALYELPVDGDVERGAERRLLWMRAFGVHAFAIGGSRSREVYKGIHEPGPLIRASVCPWHDDDDYICLVPQRTGSLAHVMMASDLASRRPSDGTDVEPLRRYADALENSAYPIADLRWLNQHTANAQVNLNPDEVVSFQITYWRGWQASANGRAVPVLKDNLGFMYIEPQCSGACSIEMTYDGGAETRIAHWVSAVTAILLLMVFGWQICARVILKKS
jgi:hypothetical protein